MGSNRFDAQAYTMYAKTATRRLDGSARSVEEVFTRRAIAPALDPSKIRIRESRDSTDNPNSTPVIIALDVTGSMGMIAHHMVGTSLGVLMTGIMDTKPIVDPHVMFMAVGDVKSDQAPLQVSQFEADIRIAQQLTDIYVEGNGGGNNTESYELPWYFAATRTETDSFANRGIKGYLFTIGDELRPRGLDADDIKSVFGPDQEGTRDYSADELYKMASEKWEVFHIIVEEGNYAQRVGATKVVDSWRELIGRRAVRLKDYTKISELILAVIRVNEGANPDDVVAESGDARDVVQHGLFN